MVTLGSVQKEELKVIMSVFPGDAVMCWKQREVSRLWGALELSLGDSAIEDEDQYHDTAPVAEGKGSRVWGSLERRG